MKTIDRKVNEKVKLGKALSRRELAVASGYSYEEILKFSKEEGFPIFRNKIIYSEFCQWRLSQMNVERNLYAHTHLPRLIGYKLNKPNEDRDFLASLSPQAARILEQVS